MGTTLPAAPPPAELADEARLRIAGRAGDRGLFGPDSMSWRINREAAVLVGGRRALLMQVAHPLVAAGVADHSRYRTEPLGRLVVTLDLMLTIVFGDTAGALAAASRINRTHERIQGRTRSAAGRWKIGADYDAREPRLALWVLATLIDTSVLVYETLVGPLAPLERERYYRESKRVGALLGMPEDALPATWDAFRDEVERFIAGDELAISRDARRIARGLLHPPALVPLLPRRAWSLVNPITVGLLPERLRRGYGLRYRLPERLAHAGLVRALRVAVRHLPASLTTVPHAWFAERSVARLEGDPVPVLATP